MPAGGSLSRPLFIVSLSFRAVIPAEAEDYLSGDSPFTFQIIRHSAP